MSLLTTLLVGSSGLRAAQAGVNATSHNVANATTEGFTRRSVVTSVADPLRDGNTWLGQGSVTEGIDRVSNRILTERVITEIGGARQTEFAWETLRSLERLMDAGEGVTSKGALDAFWDSLSKATADPADLSLRRGVVREGQFLSSVINRDARAYASALSDHRADAEATLPQVNEALGRVAQLNKAIASSQGGTLAAGDLIDQRDQLLRELGGFIGIRVDIGADQVATVFVGDHVAVNKSEARTLSMDPDADDPRLLLSHSKNEQIDVTDGIGGEIGGHIQVWAEVRDWLDKLETFAADFATSFNAQHNAGFDLSGDPGLDVFTFDAADPARSLNIDMALFDDASLLAFGSTSPTFAGDIGNLRALLDLENVDTIGGSRTSAEWLTDLVSEVGSDVFSLEQQALTQDGLLRDLEELHQNLHGVDLDEEAQNLMLYQAAYEASARVVTTTNAMVGTLLELVR